MTQTIRGIWGLIFGSRAFNAIQMWLRRVGHTTLIEGGELWVGQGPVRTGDSRCRGKRYDPCLLPGIRSTAMAMTGTT
jgi:hypothetical protein